MEDRFSPHPLNSSIMVGKTYKIKNYIKPWDVDKAMREELIRKIPEVSIDQLQEV